MYWPAIVLMSLTTMWPAAAPVDFERDVRPLLERRCVSCHQPDVRQGKLSLATRADALQGGEQGAVIVPGRPDESLLLQYVAGPTPEMPKNGEALTTAQVQLLRDWIAAGAAWPAETTLRELSPADRDWWSLRPLAQVEPPSLKRSATPSKVNDEVLRNPIDQFIIAQLQSLGLEPSPPADRRTLIRRLTFDLLGLPPTPDEVLQFVNDTRPDAYEQLVERLLASPLYGERWARHWLDVVHYGETHGYDKDKPRPNAWPYRDYVVRALNTDKPYREFVLEQLAGDVVAPYSVDGTTALGFIAAGPWDLIGHAEVPETKTDGKIARNLDRDDMVVTALNSFCSITVQCARCHAHKFDPVSQVDYYRLQAVFAALDRADRPYDADPAVSRQRVEWMTQLRQSRQLLDQRRQQIQASAGPRWQQLQEQIAQLQRASTSANHPPQHGYHSRIESQQDREKWVQIDLGKKSAVHQIVLRPCYDDFQKIGAGFGFPRRYRVDVANDPDFREGVVCLRDSSTEGLPNLGLAAVEISGDGLAYQFVRVTATQLAPRSNDYIFALAELEVLDANRVNLAAAARVSALDSIEAPIRWQRQNLTDGRFPTDSRSDTAAQLTRLNEELSQLLQDKVAPEILQQQRSLAAEQTRLEHLLASLPPPQLVYAGTIHHGQGAFRGTGPDEGRPRPIAVLLRGDVNRPDLPVLPGAPELVPGWPAEFILPTEHSESARRLALAQWIVDPRNPLTWRSIVNRIWHYHFGQGIVDSPNDFGRMGQRPSHPELLDYLAIRFLTEGQSLKSLHRWIVTSATYQQSSKFRGDAAAIDAENRNLWRAPRRKLDAEAVRDSLLFVSGLMNTQMGGPGFQDFVIQRPEHSPHYEYHLHDAADPKSHRRSVYRFLVRSQPQPFMSVFDCADPSISVEKRNESINALQALALLNNKLTLVAAEHFAKRLIQETPRLLSPEAERDFQVNRAVLYAFARESDHQERQILGDYLQQYGLENTCRLIMNLNEFVFLD